MFPLQEVRKNKVLDLRDIRNLWVWVFCKFPNVVHKQVTATLPAGAEVSILNIQDWRGGWCEKYSQVGINTTIKYLQSVISIIRIHESLV